MLSRNRTCGYDSELLTKITIHRDYLIRIQSVHHARYVLAVNEFKLMKCLYYYLPFERPD